jgi:hypothetical protein
MMNDTIETNRFKRVAMHALLRGEVSPSPIICIVKPAKGGANN